MPSIHLGFPDNKSDIQLFFSMAAELLKQNVLKGLAQWSYRCNFDVIFILICLTVIFSSVVCNLAASPNIRWPNFQQYVSEVFPCVLIEQWRCKYERGDLLSVEKNFLRLASFRFFFIYCINEHTPSWTYTNIKLVVSCHNKPFWMFFYSKCLICSGDNVCYSTSLIASHVRN